jgi:RNA polymerase sigma-70 factor (ECF subfamily)
VNDAAARLYEGLLILRCQAGDEAALSELIARYSPGLHSYLGKLTGRKDSADDLLQETWIDVYRKINRLQQPAAFDAWIYRIARDKAYRELRRRPTARQPVDIKLAESIAAKDEELSREDAERVRASLDQLPLEQREILVLRFVYVMSYEQIAEMISRPVGTVRSRIHYAKIALRQKMESKPVGKVLPP